MLLHLYFRKIFIPQKMLRCVFFSCIPASLFYVGSLLILRFSGLEVLEILRDPAVQLEQSGFLGFLSNIGIWLWISSAAICFFSALNYNSIANSSYKELLFLVGMFSLLLAVDDSFLIHDRYINEDICYLIYASLAGALLIRHFKELIEINGFTFLLAGFLLALSIFTDLIQSDIPVRYTYSQILEEGFKFVGAATWLCFSCSIASLHLAKKNGCKKLI